MSHVMKSAKVRSLAALAALLGLCASGTLASAAEAINYVEIFRANAIKCVHSSANPEKATIEVLKAPETVGEITTVRLKAYYETLIKKNVKEADLMVRQAGSIRQMKIKMLSDSGTALLGCDLEKTWKDF